MFLNRFFSILIFFIPTFTSCNLLAQSRLWGTTTVGFESGIGGIFSVSIDGKFYEANHHFGENPGSKPTYCDILHASDGKLYGMTTYGGTFDAGVIFQLDTAGYKYKAIFVFNKKNGAEPYGSLIQARDGKFYGMTLKGGLYNQGVLFIYHPDSATFRVLHHFKDTASGNWPYGDLIQASNGLLYGMTSSGGIYNKGVIFSYNPVKDTFIKRFNFNDTLGSAPRGSLTQVRGKLYGVTQYGGTNTGRGAIFSIDTSTYKVTRHYSFGSQTGEYPIGKLIMASNGRLYGVATAGGLMGGGYSGDWGTVFSIDTAKHTFAVIRQFGTAGSTGSLKNPIGSLVKLGNGKLYGSCYTNSNYPYQGGIYSIQSTSNYKMEKTFTLDDPAIILSPLSVLSKGNLIGMANSGGNYMKNGGIYTFDTSAKTVKNLIEFNTFNGGKNCNGFLTLASNGLLYGTTVEGGKDNNGVLFSINPKTNEMKILHDFKYSAGKGMNPRTKLVQSSDGKLWGVTAIGGKDNVGTIFSFDTVKNAISWEYEFKGYNDGGIPEGNVIIDSSGLIYGTTSTGGNNNKGIFYSYNPTSKVFSKLVDFKDTVSGSHPNGYLSHTKDGKIIGSTNYGGKIDKGAVFIFNPKDTTLKIVLSFADSTTGLYPSGGLTLADNGLYYGMARYGGANNSGTIFSFNDSTRKAKLIFSFKDTATGRNPQCNLTKFHNGLLYGMTGTGGSYGVGAVFSFNPKNSEFVKILNFNSYNGASPYGELTEVYTEPNRWTGKKDSLWTEKENWSKKKLPSEVQESVIPANVKRFPLINKHSGANTLIIDSGAVINIGLKVGLTINEELVNNGTINVFNEGSLLPGTAYIQSGSGIFNVHRQNLSEDTTDFSLWSSPVINSKASVLPGQANKKMRFKPGGKTFSDFIKINNTDTLIPSLGYSVGGDSITSFAISGFANNGIFNTVVKSDTGQQIFNLLGNPYPGTINAGKFIEKNQAVLDRVIYLKLNKSDSTKFNTDDLTIINDIGAIGGGISDSGITLKTTDIGAVTGFFTLALKSDTVKFDNSLRNGNAPTFSTMSMSAKLQKIKLTLTAPDSFYSQTICAFSQLASDNYDIGQDAYNFQPGNGVSIYSLLNQFQMAIQSYSQVDSTKTMPLGLRSSISGKYKVQLQEDNPLDYYRIYLQDHDSNKVYDLRKESAIIYLNASKTFNQRFYLNIVKILPTIKVVKNKVCKGDTAIFSVSEPNSKFRYQWIFNGKAEKVDTLVTFKTVKAGTLVLRQIYSDQNSDETIETDVIILDLPKKPELKRNIAEISTAKGYAGYMWYRNDNVIADSVRHSLIINKHGNYYCIVSDSNKCSNRSDTSVLARVEIDVIQNNMCPGEKAVAQVKNAETGFKYFWVINGKISQADTNLTVYLSSGADIELIMYHPGGFSDTSSPQKVYYRKQPVKPILTNALGILDADNGYVSYRWFWNSKVLSGDTSQTLKYLSNGEYYCVVKNVDACENYSDTIKVKRVSISTLVNNPCDGDTAKFEVSELKKGFKYKWELDGKIQTKDTTLFFHTIKGGVLKLIEYNNYGYKDTSFSVKINIRPLPLVPKIILKDAGLDAGTGYDKYRWFRNPNELKTDTIAYLNLKDTGTYWCIVKNKEACQSSSSPFIVKRVEITEIRNRVCIGDSAAFGILQPKSGFRYRWIFDNLTQQLDTGNMIYLKKSGSLRIVEFNSYGYSDTSKIHYSVVNPLPALPLILLNNAQLDAGAGYTKYNWYNNGMEISGADSQMHFLSSTGKYTCKVLNTFGCAILSNDYQIQAASIGTFKNHVCEGDSACFKILNKKSGFTYKWFLDGNPISLSNDSQFCTLIKGEVKLRETNFHGYIEVSDSVSAVINPLPKPDVLLFKNGILDAGSQFDTYKWYKNGIEMQGKNGQLLAPDGPAEYYAVLGLNTCTAKSPPVQFKKVELLAIDSNFCPGYQANLEVQKPDTNFQYQWLNDGSEISGEKTTRLFTSLSGNVQVIQWHPSGYSDTSDAKTILQHPVPIKPVLIRNQQLLNAGGSYYNYQWFHNDQPIPGETNQTHTMKMNGFYNCKVGNQFDCYSYSDTLNVENLLIQGVLNELHIRLMPNPTTYETYISISGSGTSVITVTDMQGKVLSLLQGVSVNDLPVGMKFLPSGMYIVIVESEGTFFHYRLIKN
jgi:uncharacterized repeat protein (TIGR03803 family)